MSQPHQFFRFGPQKHLILQIKGESRALAARSIIRDPDFFKQDRETLKTFNFCHIDFGGVDLQRVNFSGLNIGGCNFADTNLRSAVFDKAMAAACNFARADLTGVSFKDTIFIGSCLAEARLSDANLCGCDLSEADLRPFKADLWMTLTENKIAVAGLVQSIQAGHVHGGTYEGLRRGLVDTIARIKSANMDEREVFQDDSRPAEQWFNMVRHGDKPGDKTGGGFALMKALQWIGEWQDLQN